MNFNIIIELAFVHYCNDYNQVIVDIQSFHYPIGKRAEMFYFIFNN